MSEDQDFQKHHQPKPCSHCGGFAGYAPIPEMDYHEADVYFCHRCQAEYIYFRGTGNLASVSLYTTINGKMYRWSTNRTIGQLWRIKIPGIPGEKKNEGVEMIRSFNPDVGEAIPNITPENIEEKIRTILVFS
jgi:hypothetical protein